MLLGHRILTLVAWRQDGASPGRAGRQGSGAGLAGIRRYLNLSPADSRRQLFAYRTRAD